MHMVFCDMRSERSAALRHGAAHPDGNAMLAAAMAQESGRGGGGGGPADPFADLNIQFKEARTPPRISFSCLSMWFFFQQRIEPRQGMPNRLGCHGERKMVPWNWYML